MTVSLVSMEMMMMMMVTRRGWSGVRVEGRQPGLLPGRRAPGLQPGRRAPGLQPGRRAPGLKVRDLDHRGRDQGQEIDDTRDKLNL